MVESIDIVCERMFRSVKDWQKVLLGGFLCLTVIGIPFAFGYLFRYVWQVRVSGKMELPTWGDWPNLFKSGIHFLGVWAAWFLAPLVVAFIISAVLNVLFAQWLWWASYLIVAVVWLVLPVVFSSALINYQRKQEWSALLEFNDILRKPLAQWRRLIMPILAWIGMMALGFPLFPFAFFLAFLVILGYSSLLFLTPDDGVWVWCYAACKSKDAWLACGLAALIRWLPWLE